MRKHETKRREFFSKKNLPNTLHLTTKCCIIRLVADGTARMTSMVGVGDFLRESPTRKKETDKMKKKFELVNKNAREEAGTARMECGLEPFDGRTYKLARVTFTTDEGKFRGKRFDEPILDDEAFETLDKILAPMGVHPGATDIVVIEQHLDHIDEHDCEHWKVTADILFAA